MATLSYKLLERQWPTHTPHEHLVERVHKSATSFLGEMIDKLWGWSEDAQMVSGESFAERDVEDLFRSVCKQRGVKVELTDYEAFSEPDLVTNRSLKLVLRGPGWTALFITYFQIENGTVYGMNDDEDEGRPADNLGSVGVLMAFDAEGGNEANKMGHYFDRRLPKIKEAA